MRFEKPSYAREVQERQGGQAGPGGAYDIEDGPGPAFCIPADGVHCSGCQWDARRGVCFRNDCDALFTPPELRRQQQEWEESDGSRKSAQLIITAGPERSGSTWLFNAVRLLFQHARQPLDSYWLKDVTDAALDARGVGQAGGHHVLVKTHAWSGAFDLSRATHVIVTHRDLRQVLASYRRMTWEFELPESYLDDHFKWKAVAELDIAFEDIIQRPKELLRDLAARLGLPGVNLDTVLRDVSNLPVPSEWVDPVTQIWPSHISAQYEAARKAAAAAAARTSAAGEAGSSRADPDTPPATPGTAMRNSMDAKKGRGAMRSSSESLGEAMDGGLQPPTPSERAQLDKTAAADRLMQRFPEFFRVYGYA